jgi:CheY-like chemotaxis protein
MEIQMIKVMIVDDERFVRRGIIQETDWELIGCEVVAEATNGIEALEKAKEVLEKEKEWIKNEAHHFKKYTEEELEEEFEIEESETRWYINDPSDDYYEDFTIVEKEIE